MEGRKIGFPSSTQQLSISQIVCEVNLEPPNPKSLKFHSSLGFHKVTQLTTQGGREVLFLSKKLD